MCASTDSSSIAAVDSRNLYLTYTKGSSKVIALNNLTLRIPIGCIFCLIGPSGCGKTSYLRSLIGLIKVQSGSTQLFGYPLGHRNLMIPGKSLGYMPQEVALNEDLTIGEMLAYFNRLLNTYSSSNVNCVDRKVAINLKDNSAFLRNLSLPSEDTLIGSLSGGQKRRVSFLCSLLHSPKLIILDEPTVGCDPIVICSMWKLLRSITSNGQSTIIITTHYLEEARKTDTIGFMRKGQLLEQGTPSQVLHRLSVNSIESAFALLCQQYKKNKQNRSSNRNHQPFFIHEDRQTKSSTSSDNNNHQQSIKNNQILKSSSNLVNGQLSSSIFSKDWLNENLLIPLIVYSQLTYAITHRLYLRQFKIKNLLLGSILAITLLVSLAKLCTGGTPVVTVGVVNNEEDYQKGSQIYLKHINSQLIKLIPYNSSDLARHDSLRDHLVGYLTISNHFTTKLISKYSFNEDFGVLIDSEPVMVYHGDNIRSIVVKTVTAILESALDESLPLIMNASGLNPALGSPFAVTVDPLAAPESSIDLYNSLNYWMPKFVVFWSFQVTLMLSSFTFYRDRTEPLFERNLSTGTTLGQFVISHFITSMIIPLINGWPVMLISVYLLGLPQKGSLILAWLIYVFNSATAIVTSFAIASIPIDIAFIYILDSAYLFSGLASTGLLWPFHALPYFLKPYVHLFPFVVNCDSLIRVLTHGNSWNDSVILLAFAQNLGYIILTLIVVRLMLTLY